MSRVPVRTETDEATDTGAAVIVAWLSLSRLAHFPAADFRAGFTMAFDATSFAAASFATASLTAASFSTRAFTGFFLAPAADLEGMKRVRAEAGNRERQVVVKTDNAPMPDFIPSSF